MVIFAICVQQHMLDVGWTGWTLWYVGSSFSRVLSQGCINLHCSELFAKTSTGRDQWYVLML